MAHDIGLTVPPSKLHLLDDGDCALLVQRFDRTGQLRHHYLSAVSLISPPADFERRQMDTPYGASIFSYARIADVIRAVSSDITHDMLELFARMVLNILVHNTDDHLKNTGFLLDTQSPGFRYRLSPLFDVVTQEGTLPHLIHIGPLAGREGSIENALSGVEQWGIKLEVARDLVQRVQAVVARREQYYQKAGMSDSEIKSVQRWLGG